MPQGGQQPQQTAYPYHCTQCGKDAIISETKKLEHNGVLMKAVHDDKSIEDHTWPAYDFIEEDAKEETDSQRLAKKHQKQPQEEQHPTKQQYSNSDIHSIIRKIDNYYSYTIEEYRQLLKDVSLQLIEKQCEIAQLGIMKQNHDRYFNDLKELKKRYEICELCNKKGVREYDKDLNIWYCAKHLKEIIRLNEAIAPTMNKLMGIAADMKKPERTKQQYASYEETRQFAASNKIGTRKVWRKYIREHKDEIPANIPTRPDVTYAGKEWNGWKALFAGLQEKKMTQKEKLKKAAEISTEVFGKFLAKQEKTQQEDTQEMATKCLGDMI